MICGTGIDIIEIERLKRVLKKSGDRFFEKVFTAHEIAYCTRTKNLNVKAQCFAGRFSAKEAFLKAIGTGWRDGLSWTDIEIRNDELGKPFLIVKNRAKKIIEKENVKNIQLSISHGRNHAAAVVILEK